MSRNIFTIKKEKNSPITEQKLIEWFNAIEFKSAVFENGYFETYINSMGSSIYHRIIENEGYTSFIKPGYGGSMLVFEMKITDSEINFQCYSPIVLVVIRIELSFIEKPMWITKYRKEGYQYMVQLKDFLASNS